LTIAGCSNSDNIVQDVIQRVNWPDLSSIHPGDLGIYPGMQMAAGEETVDPLNAEKGRAA
jgi:hypothetical protein